MKIQRPSRLVSTQTSSTTQHSQHTSQRTRQPSIARPALLIYSLTRRRPSSPSNLQRAVGKPRNQQRAAQYWTELFLPDLQPLSLELAQLSRGLVTDLTLLSVPQIVSEAVMYRKRTGRGSGSVASSVASNRYVLT